MLWVLPVIILFIIGSGIVSASFFSHNPQKCRDIFIDLGLSRSLTGQSNPPYYKWGWRKPSRDRIWAERIVRQAFEKANLALSPEDLSFFEARCNEHELNHPVDEDSIRHYIAQIAQRAQHISGSAAAMVREVAQYILSVTPSEADSLLNNMGIRSEGDDPLQRLTRHELRRKLKQAGLQILGILSKGMDIANDSGEVLCSLQGSEGWHQFLQAFRQECLSQFSRRIYPPYTTVFAAVKSSVQAGLFKDFFQDLQESRAFLFALENEFVNKELSVTPEEARKLEAILYTWQLSEGTPFNYVDHKRCREFLGRRHLSARFREMIVRALQPDIGSLFNLAGSFPRRVIFYGRHSKARSFASEQYLTHLEQLLEALPRRRQDNLKAPLLVRIREEDIAPYRSSLTEFPSGSSTHLHRTSVAEQRIGTLTDLLERESFRALSEKNIPAEQAEVSGMIIDLPLGSPSEEEIVLLNAHPYRSFVRFLCDVQGDIDFDSISHNAKKQRILFFNMMLDSLVNTPAIDTHTTAERLAAMT